MNPLDIEAIRKDFPILQREIHPGNNLFTLIWRQLPKNRPG